MEVFNQAAYCEGLPKDVLNFLNFCCETISRFKMVEFESHIILKYAEEEINSPIEQILFCALETIREINYIEKAEPFDIDAGTFLSGLAVYPQYQIGEYRCDFFVGYYKLDYSLKKQKAQTIIVECDSQEFHERTEKERRYEKMRDRFFLSQGYKVFRYTGKEIIERPLDIAIEIIAFVTENKIEEFNKEI